MNPQLPGCADIDLAIIDKQRFRRGNTEAAESVLVDGRIGLDQSDFRREGLKVKILDPLAICPDMRRQIERHVRQQAGLDSSETELAYPVEHVRIHTRPDFDFQFAQELYLPGVDRSLSLRRQLSPVFFGAEGAAVIGIPALFPKLVKRL